MTAKRDPIAAGEPLADPASGWLETCPPAVRRDARLGAIRDYVAQPAVLDRLQAHHRYRRYPRDVLDELRRRGLSELLADATAWHGAALNAVLAARDGSLAITVGVNTLALLPVYLDGAPALRETVLGRVREGAFAAMLLSEWDHGSNLLRNQARATPVEAGFSLRGEKHLINGGGEHELLTVLCRTRDPSAGPAAYGDHTLLWLERDDTVRALPRYRTIPGACADISGVAFEDTFVPAKQVVGGVGEGFAVTRRTLVLSRGGVAALAAGAACGALELAAAYARSRDIYGGPIAALGAIERHLWLAEEAAYLSVALSARATAWANAFGQGAAIQTAAAKLLAPAHCERAVEHGRAILGARALLEDQPFSRFLRDTTLYGAFDGTRHVVLDELSQRLAQLVGGARPDQTPYADKAAAAWCEAPRPLTALRRLPPARPTDPRDAARYLASKADAAWLPALCGALFSTYEALDRHSLLEHQGTRFELAECFAALEAIFAGLELASTALARAVGAPTVSFAPALRSAVVHAALAEAIRLRHLCLAAAADTRALREVEDALAAQAHGLRRRHPARDAAPRRP
jgi:alkylation response protein AidB-like acyl-CoA dehydrogenase